MKFPNADRAFIADEKLRDYCLNPEPPRGRHKALVRFTNSSVLHSAPHRCNLSP